MWMYVLIIHFNHVIFFSASQVLILAYKKTCVTPFFFPPKVISIVKKVSLFFTPLHHLVKLFILSCRTGVNDLIQWMCVTPSHYFASLVLSDNFFCILLPRKLLPVQPDPQQLVHRVWRIASGGVEERLERSGEVTFLSSRFSKTCFQTRIPQPLLT